MRRFYPFPVEVCSGLWDGDLAEILHTVYQGEETIFCWNGVKERE
jgi:hypothetical protein